LESQAAQLKALLGLDASATTARLAALVPADVDGKPGDVSTLAQRLLSDVSRLDMKRVRETVFDGGVPESFGNEDSLIHQIRADVIADRMSYKGFTPVAVFGLFRASPVNGVFLEAPDPRSIQAGLQDVLSDSVRRELESQGRMEDLSAQLHLLMTNVSGRAELAQRQAAAVEAAQARYRQVAARVDQGLEDRTELLAAQDELVGTWLDLSTTLAQLKGDFISLVTELEALGYDSSKLLSAPSALPDRAADAAPTPAARLADYASRRSLDPAFAERVSAALAALPGAGPAAAKAYTDAASTYREMSERVDELRHKTEFTPRERLDLMTKADVEGRRQQVEAVMRRVLDGVQDDPQARQALEAVLGSDLTAQTSDAESKDASARALAAQLRADFLEGLSVPFELRGKLDALGALHVKLSAARQTLREEALRAVNAPDFVLRDASLDRYLRLEAQYDEAVVRLYQDPAVKADKDLAGVLNGLHPLETSLERRQDLMRQGRGLLAIDALIDLQQDRLTALRWERGLPAQYDEALAALHQLTDLRAAWAAKDPRGLSPLVALTQPGPDGTRRWSAAEWMTEAQLESLYGKVSPDKDKRRFVTKSDGTRWEVIGGVDLLEARLAAARGARDLNATEGRLFQVLQTNDFALVPLDGGAVAGLSYDKLAEAARRGQTFVYSTAADGRGLHPAEHPLKSLWSAPAAVETILYTGAAPLSRDRFPTRESLAAYVGRLSAAKDPAAKDFYVLEAGPAGLVRLQQVAKEYELRSERAGWVGVKLQSYGVAVDAAGR
ncbi:MAG: hypothetical protein KGL53_14390, partial [Elusimicrobia bacterium]|nr:hypothetical protein [Elusimicrobiota bacterium]